MNMTALMKRTKQQRKQEEKALGGKKNVRAFQANCHNIVEEGKKYHR